MRTRTGLALALAALLVVPSLATAQVRRDGGSKAWVDVNFGMQNSAAEDNTTFDFDFILFGETATLRAIYPKPSRGNLFDVNGGVMFNSRVGIGAGLTNVMHADPVGLSVTLPHPLFFNAFGTGTGQTDEDLARTERDIHVFMNFVAKNTDKIVVRVSGGLTFFMYRADMVQDIFASQSAGGTPSQNTVTITGFNSEFATGTGVGFNVGADFSYFFNDVFGVGVGGRFTRGNVTVDEEPMSEVEQKIRVGGTQVFGGIRLRFGRR